MAGWLGGWVCVCVLAHVCVGVSVFKHYVCWSAPPCGDPWAKAIAG